MNLRSNRYPRVTLLGHPFARIGMGEHVRCMHRSLKRAAVDSHILDIYGLETPEESQRAEFAPVLTRQFGDINIFNVNGDEVEQSMSHVTYNSPLTGYNIIYPAWELSRYPTEWARQLDRFDEIWAPSGFVADCLRAACRKPVFLMTEATEVQIDAFVGRRRFGIPDDVLTFLFFFDLRSYIERKNPRAVVEAFRGLLGKRPYARVRLVVKVNNFDAHNPVHQEFRESLAPFGDRVIPIFETLTDNEVKNLVRCTDCFVSLHRSEGYGRGLAEAMYLGKPVIGTAYSGNLDFMAPEVSMHVGYRLVPVRDGEYPHHLGQQWADPDIDEAVAHMVRVVDDPARARQLGAAAALHMLKNFAYRPTGVRYRERLDALWAAR